MGPYRKVYRREIDAWQLKDGVGEVIGVVETETMADYMLAALIGEAPKPPVDRFTAGQPYGGDSGQEDQDADV